jgi:hypothetical protein
MLNTIRHRLSNPKRFALFAVAAVSLMLTFLVGPAVPAYAHDCNAGFCGRLFNGSDQLIRVAGDSHHKVHYCDIPPGTDSRSCTEFQDVDKFTFPNYNNFRVCQGRFCWAPSLFPAGYWYVIHGEDVFCDHPKGHYARCRLFALVIPESKGAISATSPGPVTSRTISAEVNGIYDHD